jgi:ribosomal protein S18 acetylase RimI-like enzyme
MRANPDALAVVLAEESPEGPALCAAWLRYTPGTDFASMWGGSTLPEWRRRGLYRATVTHRARLARDRGYRYMRLDTSPDSRPILERLGLRAVATTTPYLLDARPGMD